VLTIVHENIDMLSYPENRQYRVNIKSFHDYRHLLQENYVEYKHFLPLLKLVSKLLCHVMSCHVRSCFEKVCIFVFHVVFL